MLRNVNSFGRLFRFQSQAPGDTLRVVPITQPPSSLSARRLAVLIVDDEPGIAQTMADVATGLGCVARAVPDWKTAEAEAAAADVILLDLMMPDIDGVSALRALAAAGVQARIVLVSGVDSRVLDSARRVARMQNLDVVDVLRKPFRAAQLRAILSALATRPRIAQVPKGSAPRAHVTLDDIGRALERHEFFLMFQPQVRLPDLSWIGLEALARWQHPELGELRPDVFVPLIERSPQALPFTYAVIADALAALNRIAQETGFAGSLAVNVPPAALTTADFPDHVLRLLAAAGIDSSRLTIELTETSIPADATLSLDIETRLRMHGIRLSIDDFGTGHSSLERLHETPFDEMKIDMVLVREADHDPALRKIAESAIALGRDLSMTVVAEGVETATTLAWLSGIGCDIAQGYHVAGPLTLDELRCWAAGRSDASGSGQAGAGHRLARFVSRG